MVRKIAKPTADELMDRLLTKIEGMGWKHTIMPQWTPAMQAAYDLASSEEKRAYLEWLLDYPMTVIALDPGEDIPPDLPPDVAVVWKCSGEL